MYVCMWRVIVLASAASSMLAELWELQLCGLLHDPPSTGVPGDRVCA